MSWINYIDISYRNCELTCKTEIFCNKMNPYTHTLVITRTHTDTDTDTDTHTRKWYLNSKNNVNVPTWLVLPSVATFPCGNQEGNCLLRFHEGFKPLWLLNFPSFVGCLVKHHHKFVLPMYVYSSV